MMNKRSKIQWMFYLKENLWNIPKNSKTLQKKYWEVNKTLQKEKNFQKFTHKKWIDVLNFLTKKNKDSAQTILNKKLLKKRRYFKTMLQQKHRFKLYYAIKKEKKFKKILRNSFKYQNEKSIFNGSLINRLDTILVSMGYVPQKNIAQLLIKSNLILINDKIENNLAYQVQLNDVISIDDRIKFYILKNFKQKQDISKVFEINYKTLDAILLENNNFSHSNDFDIISLDFIRRYYKK